MEDQHLNVDKQSGRSPGTVPGKIRDIVTKSIPSGDPTMASTSPLGDENRMLNSEINRLEDLLAATRAERDEIGSKYMAVSDRVSWFSENLIFSIRRRRISIDFAKLSMFFGYFKILILSGKKQGSKKLY